MYSLYVYDERGMLQFKVTGFSTIASAKDYAEQYDVINYEVR